MKHTQGPWVISNNEIEALVDPENSQTYYAPICSMDTDWRDDIMKANIRLIKVAPELLDTLEDIVLVLKSNPAWTAEKIREWVTKQANRAISRTTGES